MDDDELARRISDEGVSLRGYRMEFKEVRLSKLHSKIVYVRRVSLSRSFSKKSSQSSSKPNTELESFKEILANIYISNGTIMVFALRNLLQQKILRNSMDRIRASVTNNQKLELPNLLKSLQQRKRLNY
jgi:Tfp pilus assembly ATPase PilU